MCRLSCTRCQRLGQQSTVRFSPGSRVFSRFRLFHFASCLLFRFGNRDARIVCNGSCLSDPKIIRSYLHFCSVSLVLFRFGPFVPFRFLNYVSLVLFHFAPFVPFRSLRFVCYPLHIMAAATTLTGEPSWTETPQRPWPRPMLWWRASSRYSTTNSCK